MKISIIIVSYNEKQYIEETIHSCLFQKMPYDYEIIIGDDGSSDGSIELIQQYKEKYPSIISYFIMDRNDVTNIIPSIRVSNVLKRAFELARGEYITVISGDDLLLNSKKLKKQIEFLDKNSRYVSCYTDFKKFGLNQDDLVCKMKSTLTRPTFWSQQYVHISCFVFRRKKVVGNLLDRFCDDTGLIFSIFKAGKSRHIKGIDFGYRQRDASIMHESDDLELSILELMLYQDVLNKGGYEKSSLSRFSRPLEYVNNHKEKLSNSKYQKYLLSCSKCNNNLLNEILNDENNYYYRKVIMSKVYKKFFAVLRKLETVKGILLEH